MAQIATAGYDFACANRLPLGHRLMNENEVVSAIREHLEGLFPKTCGTCGRRYRSLREYITETTPVGPPMSYDADARNWAPESPIGAVVFANCECGSTLGLTNDGMPRDRLLAVMDWLKSEVQGRRVTPSTILAELRERVRQSVSDQHRD